MGRSPCCDKTQVKRGPWSPQEDETLKSFLRNHGTAGNWITLPQKAGLKRCGKSCRLRWLNYLRPDIKHGAFTIEEDDIICNLYSKMGSRWSVIASHLPGRTDNDVKNHWNTKLKKKLMTIKAITANKDKDINNAAKNIAYDDPKIAAFLIQTSPKIIPFQAHDHDHYNIDFPEGTFGFGPQFSYSGSLQPQENAKVSDQSSSFAKNEYITAAAWSDNYGGGSNQIEGFPLMDVAMGTANSSEIMTTGLIWPQEPTFLEALPSSYSPICLAFPSFY